MAPWTDTVVLGHHDYYSGIQQWGFRHTIDTTRVETLTGCYETFDAVVTLARPTMMGKGLNELGMRG